ncbi:semaphorin-5A-like [Ruditapes philippinarum]|uniref:semaphorin-5A-like n=1 Tax=Ruditapes philippinarum TaxID=129788 RepID=UPI00295C048B|nr:semaphorin-5A-like [Ruditapes philippinarum]
MGDSGDEQTAIVRNIYDNAQIILEDSVSSGTDNYEFEYRTCQKEHCPVNGGWSQWTYFGACSVTSGTGHMTRSRQCNNPTPVHGGHDCVGVSSESASCSDIDNFCATLNL